MSIRSGPGNRLEDIVSCLTSDEKDSFPAVGSETGQRIARLLNASAPLKGLNGSRASAIFVKEKIIGFISSRYTLAGPERAENIGVWAQFTSPVIYIAEDRP